MPVTVPDEVLRSAHLTEDELRIELAVALFQQNRMTLGQAASFANLPQLDLQRILAQRRIPLHYGADAMEEDLARVKRRLGS